MHRPHRPRRLLCERRVRAPARVAWLPGRRAGQACDPATSTLSSRVPLEPPSPRLPSVERDFIEPSEASHVRRFCALRVLAGAAGDKDPGGSDTHTDPPVQGLPEDALRLHAGLAFGAFHPYIYKPFRAGWFSQPQAQKRALVKARAPPPSRTTRRRWRCERRSAVRRSHGSSRRSRAFRTD
jgi:hypothetical protein